MGPIATPNGPMRPQTSAAWRVATTSASRQRLACRRFPRPAGAAMAVALTVFTTLLLVVGAGLWSGRAVAKPATGWGQLPPIYEAMLEEAAAAETLEVVQRTELVVRGPNDGEPAGSRYLELTATTNYQRSAEINAYMENVLVGSVVLPRSDGDGRVTVEVRLSVPELERQLGRQLTSPDGPAPRFSVTLIDRATRSLKAVAAWRMPRSKPWLEPRELSDWNELRIGSDFDVAAWAHLPTGVTYFVVAAGADAESLHLSPERPELYEKARIVVGGMPSPEIQDAGGLDLSLRVSRGTYVVLWALTPNGWKRSTVYKVVP